MQRYKKSGIYARENIIYLFDYQFIHHCIFKQQSHIFPLDGVKSLITYMFDFHEPVIVVETLLKQGCGASVIVEKTDFPAVLGHDDEHLVFLWLAMKLLPDDRQNPVIFAPHVVKIAYIPEPLQTVYIQHSPSRFSTSFFRRSKLRFF